MEKIIKINANKEGYILEIGDKNININYATKTLNSQDLYNYLFKDITEVFTCEYINEVDMFFKTEEFEDMKKEDGQIEGKINRESKFILSKVEELINKVLKELESFL